MSMENEETFIETPKGLPATGELAVLQFLGGGQDRMYVVGYTESHVKVRFTPEENTVQSYVVRAAFEELLVRE